MENLKVDSAWHFSSSLYKNYFFGFSTCPISRPSISPFQPSLRGINELTRSSTRKEGEIEIRQFGQKSRPCTPRKSMQDKQGKRCTVTPLPPLFYSQGRFENFTSPFLQTHPSFLSFLLPFHPERNSRPTSLKRREPVVLSFRSVEKEKRKREKKKRKCRADTRTLHVS